MCGSTFWILEITIREDIMAERKEQIENLKSILRGFGITSSEELDVALEDALNALSIGIMTEQTAAIKDTA